MEKTKKKERKRIKIKTKKTNTNKIDTLIDTAIATNGEDNPNPAYISTSNVPTHIQVANNAEYKPIHENKYIYEHKPVSEGLIDKTAELSGLALKSVLPSGLGHLGLNTVIDSVTKGTADYYNKDHKLMNKIADYTINQNLNRTTFDKEENKKFLYDVLKTAAFAGGVGFGVGYLFPHSTFMAPMVTLASEYAQHYILNRPVEKYHEIK